MLTLRHSVVDCLRVPVLAMCLITAMRVTPAFGQVLPPPDAAPQVKLATERWSEPSFGISLQPPTDATLQQGRRGDALAVFQSPDYTISVHLRETNFAMEIADVARRAVEQMALPYPNAILMRDRPIKPAGLPGALLYFKIPDRQRPTWIMGQALVQIDPFTVVLIRLETDEMNFGQVQPIFEAVVNTLGVASPEELDAQRKEQIARGVAWRQTLTTEKVHAALMPEQWFRLVKNKKDIGYMRMLAHRGEEWDTEGIRVDIDVHMESDNQTVDTESRYFLTDDGRREVWSVKTAMRPRVRTTARRRNATPLVAESLWVETGLRADRKVEVGRNSVTVNVISVDRKDPSSSERLEWDKPPEGYLAQVEAQLLGSLLPRNEAATYGFYAWSSSTRDISFRTDRVEPLPNGDYLVHTRLSPTQPEQTSRYDAQGRLLHRMLPDGTEIRAANANEIKTIWKIR